MLCVQLELQFIVRLIKIIVLTCNSFSPLP